MKGKELLKYFRTLPEYQQTKILVDAYKQIAVLHQGGKAYGSFTWRDCCLESDELKISADVDSYFNEEAFRRNLLDYAGIIYCLTTGRTSAESMSWDAGHKIQSAVLREIVLTICGQDNSVNPLIWKLKQPYKDEETFFDGYITLAEKEGVEAYKRRMEIERENHRIEQNDRASEFHPNHPFYKSKSRPWYTKWWYFLLLFVIMGVGRACKQSKKIQHQQDVYQQRMINVRHNHIR